MKAEKRLRSKFVVGVCALGATATGAFAQPTLLPPGPPAVSGRFGPRTQITTIPYVVTAPGSYYLAATLVAGGPGNGINIESSDVTIDLGGHRLLGAGFVGSSGIDMGTPAGYSNITIHDGHIVGWSGNGIGVTGIATNIRVYNITCTGNAGDGIQVGPNSIVRDVVCDMNGGDGIQIGVFGKVTNAVAVDNMANGISALFGTHVSDSVAGSNGFVGINLGVTGVVIGSVAVDNASNGFEMMLGSRATDCVAQGNGFAAFGSGFFCGGDSNILGGCAAFNNSNSGFEAFPGPPMGGSSVHDCIAELNGMGTSPPGPGPAFPGSDGFTNFRSVVQCTANGNMDSGIECAEDAHVVRNTCTGNGGNGIIATADGNTIQQNHVADNGLVGIDTTYNPGPPGNLISSNSGHANGAGVDFVFGPPDSFGPILIVAPGPLPLVASIGNVSYP